MLGPHITEVLFGGGVTVSRWDVAWGGLGVVAAAAGSPVLAACRVANRYILVAHARAIAAAIALYLVWFCPNMQASEGYLALIALQAIAVLLAALYIVARLHSQKADLPPSISSLSSSST
jgi:hypothetical protein